MGDGNNVSWAFHASWRRPEVSGAVATLYFGGAHMLVSSHAFRTKVTGMQKPLPYCVYVLRSRKEGDLYIGYTSNLVRRLEEHARGESRSTAHRRPLDLVFCEFYGSACDARRRERYLKTSPGKRALKLMLRDTLKTSGP